MIDWFWEISASILVTETAFLRVSVVWNQRLYIDYSMDPRWPLNLCCHFIDLVYVHAWNLLCKIPLQRLNRIDKLMVGMLTKKKALWTFQFDSIVTFYYRGPMLDNDEGCTRLEVAVWPHQDSLRPNSKVQIACKRSTESRPWWLSWKTLESLNSIRGWMKRHCRKFRNGLFSASF